MKLCVECGTPLPYTWHQLKVSTSQDTIRLVHCNVCGKLADKYVEYETMIIFIDMLLHKIQVYRHLLFNRLHFLASSTVNDHEKEGFSYNIVQVLKLWFIIILFESFGRYFVHLEQREAAGHLPDVIEQSVVLMNFAFMILWISMESMLQLIMTMCTLRLLGASVFLSRILLAVVLGGFGRIFIVLTVVWCYNLSTTSWLLSVLVATSTIESVSAAVNTKRELTTIACCVGLFFKIMPVIILFLWKSSVTSLFLNSIIDTNNVEWITPLIAELLHYADHFSLSF